VKKKRNCIHRTPEIDKRMIELFQEGLSYSAISRAVGLDVSWTRKWLCREGYNRICRHTEEEKQLVYKTYKQGFSIMETAHQTGINSGSVAKWVRSAGISRPPSMANKGRFGVKSFSWKGGCCNPRTLVMGSPEYIFWRLKVFGRDGYTCASCNKHGVNLHAHHLLSYADYPLIRLDINNGITLCVSCHCKMHGRKKMGRYSA
jgi:transposase-like protein